MKYWQHPVLKYSYCKLNDNNLIKLISLNSIKNKYSYNIDCKIIFKKSKFRFNYKLPNKKNNNILFYSFIDQYF